jgi:hypothetical protein
MNWIDNENYVDIYLNKYRLYNKKPNTWLNIRKTVISRYKNTCCSCGGIYKKYLYCPSTSIDTNIEQESDNIADNFILLCKLCYMISNVEYFIDSDEMLIYHSTLSQKEIIRATIDFIIRDPNNNIPFPKEIDKNAKLVPISFLELSCFPIDMVENTINLFKNFKVFFSQNLVINFISSINIDPFIIEFDDNIRIDPYQYDLYTLNKKQLTFINNMFHL